MQLPIVLLILVLCLAPAQAQDIDDALLPYAGMIGSWSGTATAVTRSGTVEMRQTEAVSSELGGKLIVIEGLGRRISADGTLGEVEFNAYGVLSVDAATSTVYLDAFTKEGRHQRVTPVAREDGFDWGMQPERGPKIRYEIRFDDQGRWTEKGEMSMDEGSTWIPFFEMILERTDE